MDETPKVSLWNKPCNEITVGDSVKINLVAIGGVVAVVTVINVCVSVKDWAKKRRNKDVSQTELTLVESE